MPRSASSSWYPASNRCCCSDAGRIREQHLLTAGKGDGDPEDGFPMQAARNQFPAAVDRDGACNVAEIAGKGDAT